MRAVVWRRSTLLATIVTAALLAAAVEGRGETVDATSVAAKMQAAMAPAHSSKRKIEMTIRSAKGEVVTWTGRQARKVLDDGAAMVTVLLGPGTVKGFAVLVRDAGAQPDTQWVYLPPVRRVRRLVYTGKFESFLGTDFTYEDLGFVDLHGRTLTLLGKAEHAGKQVYRLREVFGDAGPYSRVDSLVAVDDYLPLRREYYDRAGLLWKVAEYGPAHVIDNVPTTLHMQIEDKQQGGKSELHVSEVSYDVEVDSKLFDPDLLPEVAAQMLW